MKGASEIVLSEEEAAVTAALFMLALRETQWEVRPHLFAAESNFFSTLPHDRLDVAPDQI